MYISAFKIFKKTLFLFVTVLLLEETLYFALVSTPSSHLIWDQIAFLMMLPLYIIYGYCSYRVYINNEKFSLRDISFKRVLPTPTYWKVALIFWALFVVPISVSTVGAGMDSENTNTGDVLFGLGLIFLVLSFFLYFRLIMLMGTLFPSASQGDQISIEDALNKSKGRRRKILNQFLAGPFAAALLGNSILIYAIYHEIPLGFLSEENVFQPLGSLLELASRFLDFYAVCLATVVLTDVYRSEPLLMSDGPVTVEKIFK